MSVMFYPAIIESGDEPGYSVFFPDLDGCVSAGDTLQEAAQNAEVALNFHLRGMLEDQLAIPSPRELDEIEHDPAVREAARMLVRAEVPVAVR